MDRAELEAFFADESRLRITDEDGEARFPDGTAVVICTNCANRVIELLGRGEVWGYFADDNPGTAAADGLDGHDFAIIDGRYLVDVWLKFVAGTVSRAVSDLRLETDAPEIRRLYGDRRHWQRISP